MQKFPVLGMDCQWLVTYDKSRSKIALLQLATYDGKIILIPLRELRSIPEKLKTILRNKNIIKTGIEVIKDAQYLQSDYNFVVSGTYDLRFLAKECGQRPEGLEKLSKKILDLDIGRDWELIASDWEADPLSDRQIFYAETAVRASIDIFKTLINYVVSNLNPDNIRNYCNQDLDRSFIWYSNLY